MKPEPSVPSAIGDPTPTAVLQERFGFPKKDGSSLSRWLEDALDDPLLNCRTTHELPLSADIVIIGSGITGTLTAKHCVETWPGKKVVVLEARGFCSGATGRNAGHCKPDQWRGFLEYQKAFGTQQALKILQTEQQTWSDLATYVQENSVDCNLWIGDTLDVPVTTSAAEIAKSIFESYKAAGGKVDHIKVTHDPTEATKDAKACYAWSASTLHPWKLAAHVMRDNLEKGVNLQTHTEVTRVVPSSKNTGSWIIQTTRGEIECSQVVHATNAYSSALEPSLRGLISPSPHICNRVVPPAAFKGPDTLKNSYGVLLPQGVLFSINPQITSGGPILFGGSNPGQRDFEHWLRQRRERCVDDSLTGFKPIEEAVQEFAEAQLVGWKNSDPDRENRYKDGWSGIIGLSADGLPFVGQLPGLPGQWICAGHHGHATIRVLGVIIAAVLARVGSHLLKTFGCASSLILMPSCLVEDPATKKQRSRNYDETLESRITFLEGVLKQYHPELANDHINPTTANNPIAESQSTPAKVTQPRGVEDNGRDISHVATTDSESDENNGLDELSSKVGLLSLNAAGAAPHYLGSSPTFAFSRFINSSLRQCVLTNSSDNVDLTQNQDNNLTLLSAPCLLPEEDVAVKLSNGYFQNVHIQYPFLHEPTFRALEAEIGSEYPDSDMAAFKPTALFFLNVVYAIGALLLPNQGYSAEVGQASLSTA
ncbi:putative FAD dependent oxidoreductase [Seiridium cupressi]